MSNLPPPESDLWLPLPSKEETWHPHTVHTHYFGFSVPEAAIGAFVYFRYQPAFPLCAGGVGLFQGLDNEKPLDIEHLNFMNTMPWSSFKDNILTTYLGLKMEVLKPGEKFRLSYKSKDGKTQFDVIQTAVTPLLPRGHVMPGEDRDTEADKKPGGSEQFMHCIGKLTLNGTDYDVDCYPVRDRSWRQIRTEEEVDYPPVGWSPMCFDGKFSFCQIGYEAPETNPRWKDVFTVDQKKPSFYFAWMVDDNGSIRNIVKIKRKVTKFHPKLFAATEQEIEAEDSEGKVYRYWGEAIAMAHIPSWANNIFVDAVYKWRDEAGRLAYCAYQEAWYAKFQRFSRGKPVN
ncbi:uncharacterized protein A1O5_11623 [Cladophialophora psammophila CBS 110553]|uniref:Uncharacterized protein n=1 Tax=Cladophialophora psammophila CBS 110553 TaxID=1182543 RepID=W9W5F5_9EURO|nr:uncharacterized protein A1O5_11623 [Cladophialophora psammophila CBS 110553]EXJ63302.1 hypothetical protein A1O5_11623 [Cladophialophora psammophila CBS 110553]